MDKREHTHDDDASPDEISSGAGRSNEITHRELIERLLALRHGDSLSKNARSFRSHCTSWVKRVGLRLDDAASLSLGSHFSDLYAAQCRELDASAPGRADAKKNMRSAAREMHRAFAAYTLTSTLPQNFPQAFRTALSARGMSVSELNQELKRRFYNAENKNWYGAQLWTWSAGKGLPGVSWRGDSKLLLQRIEVILELSPGYLSSLVFRDVTPVFISELPPIAYRQARSRQAHFAYAMRTLPEAIGTIWDRYAAWRRLPAHFVNGRVITLKPAHRWTSDQTEKMNLCYLRSFAGWMCLPAPARSAKATEEELWSHGLGKDSEELRLKDFFDPAKLWGYIEFRRQRQHNKQFAVSSKNLIIFLNTFVSQEHSFLPCQLDLAEEFGFPKGTGAPEWLEFCAQLHQSLKGMLRSLNQAAVPRQRSPDEPLRHLMNEPFPYEKCLELLDALDRDEPLKARLQTWSTWSRDRAIFRMHLEIPLRARNVIELQLGRHLTRDPETGLWHLRIPLSELKNRNSPAAQDYDRDYCAATSRCIDTYVDEGRKYMVGFAEGTKTFLLGAACGPRHDREATALRNFQMSEDGYYGLVSRRWATYFGRGQGSNIFRHVIVTSILKEDPNQVMTAAAVLNNSPETVRRNYSHLTQSDSLRTANQWLDRQRKRRKGNGDK